MRTLIAPFLSLFLLTAVSCSTEETIEPTNENPVVEVPVEEVPVETNFTEENPLPGFLSTTRYNEHMQFCNVVGTFHDIGMKFKALEKGTMNSIIVRIPVVNPNLIVTVTDIETNQVILTESVNVAAANTEVVKTIAPLILQKNKTYLITMRTNNYYKRFRNDFGQSMYPITVGNIKIVAPMTSAFSSDGSLGSSGNFCSGDISFSFLRTE